MYPPLVIYPEGGTSNGTHLLKFKKGAFAGLRSVQPIIIKYKNPVLINECCGYSLLAHSIIYGSIPGTCRVKQLPVFMPNDYFWQHHQRQGEEKWETYARVVREIMAEAGDFKISNKDVEDKYKFKDILYPHNAGNHAD